MYTPATCYFIATIHLTGTQQLTPKPIMDFVKGALGGGGNNNNSGENQQPSGSEQKSEGGFLGGIGDKLNSAAGGGAEGEKKEDGLDKG